MSTSASYNIDNHMAFTSDAEGTRKMWKKERLAKRAYSSRLREMETSCDFAELAEEDRMRLRKEASSHYYSPVDDEK